MKTTEQIIADNQVDNPSDASLVRLAALAVAMPAENTDALLKRVNFSHPGDATLARALIESVRASERPRQAASVGWVVASVVFFAAAVALGVFSYGLHRQVNAEREAARSQAEQFSKQIEVLQADTTRKFADLQTATNTALRSSDESTKQNVQTFNATVRQYAEEVAALKAQNAKLQADLDAAQNPSVLPKK